MTMTLSEQTSSTNSVSTSTGLFTEDKRAARKTRDKLIALGLEKFRKCQEERWKQEQQWYLNLAFYFGNQYVKFRTAQGQRRFDLYVPDAPYYRARPVINQTRKIVRKEIARLTAQQPNAYIVPSSTEDRDVFAAQAGEQIWSSLWRTHNFNRVIRQAVFWQATCGNGFIKQWWDSYKQDKLNKMAGDIALKAETPFHIYVPDLREEELEGQPCLIHAQVRNKDWIKNTFGIDITGAQYSMVDQALRTVLQLSDQSKSDTTIVLEVWVKPGYVPELPEGGMFTIAGDKILQGFEGWPYSHDEYPISKLDGMPSGKFYNASIIEDIIPLQRELNRTRGQIIEAKNRMAKPQLLAEEGSVLPSKITSEPGQVITYKTGFQPPVPLAMQNLPNYVTEEVNRLNTDMADLSGQHEVSQGQTPPGVTAAVAISYLQEQDESLISTHFDSLEEAIEKTARQVLSYVADYWDEPRTVKIVGIDQAFDVQTFRGSDLSGNADIRVEAGSALPTSRAAKQAFITDLMKMGFIPAQEGLEVLEIGGLNKIYERVQVDRRQAQRENLKMRVATEQDILRQRTEWDQKPEEMRIDPETQRPLNPPLLVPVNTYDNHALHIEEHNRYRKSQAFELAEPVTKALFEEHVRQHQDAMLEQAATMPIGPSGELANPLNQMGGTETSEPESGQPSGDGGVY